MAISGKGTEFRRWNSTSGAWEAIAGVLTITGPGMSRDTIDTTALDTAGGYRTFMGGFRNPGTYTFTMLFDRTYYDLMKADFESDDLQNYEVVLPDDDNTSFEFEGLITELPLSIPPDDKVTADITIQVSGEVTIESGSGPSAGA